MRKIIVLIISIIFIIGGIYFILRINSDLNNDIITENGELTYEYNKIKSINMPTYDYKIITSLDDLQKIVEGHNFNIKHSYIYIKLPTDNKHNFKITNVTQTPTGIVCLVEKTAALENIQVEVIESTAEYIIDITGIINSEQTVTVTVNDLTVPQNSNITVPYETAE